MNRRTLPSAAALVTAAALLLTACGGSDDNKSTKPDKIAGADEGSTKAASPTPSASTAPERPTIKLPGDVTDTFSPEKTGDATKDAILGDNAGYVRALDAAIVAGKPELPALEFYTEGDAAASSQEWVQSFVSSGRTVTGTTRYYNRSVTVKNKTTAAISYCGDESKGFSKVIKTGKTEKTKVTSKSYVAYGVQVQRNSQGVWETMKISSARGAASCQP
ncbi:hypothetical protein [Streptomyces sp. NBC_00859]|uniref:hypothetical protein n=1 Tax=Streptomyces sp. NBC_00859 TaxID=2903682 RepID=UPI00386E54CA|nr:hypothetical protein OG584_13965 [Streptomyces sp. NBC_00859]